MASTPTQEAAPRHGSRELTGETLSGISTGIVQLYSEHFGKGPTGAKTYALDDVLFCVLRDGFTAVERTLFEQGKAEAVREMRHVFQDAIADRFIEVVENATGRRVLAFMSQAHVGPDLSIEVFFLEHPFGENASVETDGDGNLV